MDRIKSRGQIAESFRGVNESYSFTLYEDGRVSVGNCYGYWPTPEEINLLIESLQELKSFGSDEIQEHNDKITLKIQKEIDIHNQETKPQKYP